MSRKAIKFQDLREDQWLRDFRRALGYIWPQKKYLILSILLILLGAVSYSASLSLVLPILKVMAEPEGLPQKSSRSGMSDESQICSEINPPSLAKASIACSSFCAASRRPAASS